MNGKPSSGLICREASGGGGVVAAWLVTVIPAGIFRNLSITLCSDTNLRHGLLWQRMAYLARYIQWRCGCAFFIDDIYRPA